MTHRESSSLQPAGVINTSGMRLLDLEPPIRLSRTRPSQQLRASGGSVATPLISAEPMTDIDATAAEVLEELIDELEADHVVRSSPS